MIVASIDIGTNTVLLLIASVSDDTQIETLRNEYRIPRIGKGLLPGGNITEEKITELFTVLETYSEIINKYNCERTLVTATNAFRIAANGEEIANEIRDKYNWEVKIVTGVEEARLSYLGAISGVNSSQEMLVIDIGGGSTELTFGKGQKLSFRESFKTGVVSASEKFFLNDPPLKTEIEKFRNELSTMFTKLRDMDYAPDLAIALAGTPTTLACIKQNLEQFDEGLVEGSILSYEDIEEMINLLSEFSIKEIRNRYKAVVNGREDLILSGAIILLFIMEILKIDNVLVSTKGIRFGAIIDKTIDK